MAVIRVEKTKDYTVMSNYHLGDQRLSLKAIGLLSKMLSLPEGWDYTVFGLTKICKEGRDSIRAAIQELEGAGYIQRRRLRDESGHLTEMEYVIHERPVAAMPEQETPGEDAPMEGPPAEDAPTSETPTQDNPPQLNTKSRKYVVNNPPIVPPGDKRTRRKREIKAEPDWKPDRFARFWESYPCGKDKQAAIREWDALKPSDELLREMALGLFRALQSEEWQRGIGIPYACRWIKNRRWEDEAREKEQTSPQAPEEPKGAYRL